jgi:hypothetical protein
MFRAVLLFLLSGLAAILGVLMVGNAKSAVHEIEGLLLLLAAAVFLSACFVCLSLRDVRRAVEGLRVKARAAAIPTPAHFHD